MRDFLKRPRFVRRQRLDHSDPRRKSKGFRVAQQNLPLRRRQPRIDFGRVRAERLRIMAHDARRKVKFLLDPLLGLVECPPFGHLPRAAAGVIDHHDVLVPGEGELPENRRISRHPTRHGERGPDEHHPHGTPARFLPEEPPAQHGQQQYDRHVKPRRSRQDRQSKGQAPGKRGKFRLFRLTGRLGREKGRKRPESAETQEKQERNVRHSLEVQRPNERVEQKAEENEKRRPVRLRVKPDQPGEQPRRGERQNDIQGQNGPNSSAARRGSGQNGKDRRPLEIGPKRWVRVPRVHALPPDVLAELDVGLRVRIYRSVKISQIFGIPPVNGKKPPREKKEVQADAQAIFHSVP